MSALPQPSPKLVATDPYGRDPQSAPERLRARDGWARLPHILMADLPRVSCGQSFTFLILAVLSLVDLRNADLQKGETPITRTLPVSFEYLADVCRCDIRHIERCIQYGTAKLPVPLLKIRREAKGLVSIEILWENWRARADYKAPKREKSEVANTENQQDSFVSPTPVSSGTVHLTEKPVPIAAGKQTRAFKIEQGVRSIRIRADLEVTAEVLIVDGHQLVHIGRISANTQNQQDSSVSPTPVSSGGGRAAPPVPISDFPGGDRLPHSGDFLADAIRAQTGLIVDPPACRRIEKALNGTIPLLFYLEELASAVSAVAEPKPGLAVFVAEQKIRAKWRLSQQAGPPAPQKGGALPSDPLELLYGKKGAERARREIRLAKMYAGYTGEGDAQF